MNQNFSDQDILDKDILELMGAENLPQEKKQKIYQQMMETIQNRVIAKILDQLGESAADEWKKLLDSGDKPKAEEFLKSHDVDTAKLMLEESIIYKTEMAGLAGQIKKEKE